MDPGPTEKRTTRGQVRWGPLDVFGWMRSSYKREVQVTISQDTKDCGWAKPATNFELYSPWTLTYRPCKLMVGRWHFLLTWSLFSHQVYCNARAGYFFGRNMFANVPNGGWLEKFQIIFSNMFRFAPRPLERLYVCFAPRVPADDFCVSTLWDVSPRSHWIKEPTCSWWSWRWWVWSLERLLTIKIKKAPVIDGCTPPKTNMEPKNGGWEDDFPFRWVIFRFHVNFQGCTAKYSGPNSPVPKIVSAWKFWAAKYLKLSERTVRCAQ